MTLFLNQEKRAAYPRLYFLSDEDLLELVSGGRGLQAHLPKLYPGVGGAVTENNNLKAVVSPEGEKLKLPNEVDTTEPLPEWLAALETGIRDALRLSLDECLTDSSPDPSRYPAQVTNYVRHCVIEGLKTFDQTLCEQEPKAFFYSIVFVSLRQVFFLYTNSDLSANFIQILLLSERIRFTERCERAMREGTVSLKNLVEALEAQRARYRGLEDVGDKLTALKARGLLLDVVHHLGVVRSLLATTATTFGSGNRVSWEWSRQLRTYRGVSCH